MCLTLLRKRLDQQERSHCCHDMAETMYLDTTETLVTQQSSVTKHATARRFSLTGYQHLLGNAAVNFCSKT
jgi:hypothetical protein